MTVSFRWLLAALLALASLPCLAQAVVVPEAPPVLVFGEVGMVAARPMAEITGATIAAQGKTLTLTRDTHRFTCSVGSTAATQDGKKLTLPLAPFQYLGVTYVPVTAFITALGGTATPGDGALQVTLPGRDPFMLTQQSQEGTPEELQLQTYNIYLAGCDGNRVQQLTYDVVNEDALNLPHRQATFTLDGKAIIYAKDNNVVQRRLDAAAITNRTAAIAGAKVSTMPMPCPDGSMLLVQMDRTATQNGDTALPQICRISADGTECKSLVTGAFYPVVSADGKTIAYTDITDMAKPLIHVMNADGTNNRALFPGIPRIFSPDGKTLLALRLEGEGENMNMAVTLSQVALNDDKVSPSDVPSDLSNQQSTCAFSPDGKRVVYQNGEDGIWVMNADHTDKHKLSDGKDTVPLFSPEGTRIAFLRNDELYVMQDDGTHVKALTPGMIVVGFAFSPDGKQLLFSGVPREALTPKKPAEPAPAATKPATGKYQPPTEAEVAAAKRAGTRTALIKTAKGDITVELYGKDAPLTVANFVKLAQAKFYDGLTFHRVVEDFVIQGGDPDGNGGGGPGYSIKLEIAPGLKHVDGALAMARAQDPDSAGSQFYITIGEQSFLDGNYAVFGKVITGLDIVRKIAVGDKIISVTVR